MNRRCFGKGLAPGMHAYNHGVFKRKADGEGGLLGSDLTSEHLFQRGHIFPLTNPSAMYLIF